MQFKALGRDIAAAANSQADDQALSTALVWFCRYADIFGQDGLNNLYDVKVAVTDAEASIVVKRLKKDAYEPPVFTEPVDATAEELRRQEAAVAAGAE